MCVRVHEIYQKKSPWVENQNEEGGIWNYIHWHPFWPDVEPGYLNDTESKVFMEVS